MKTFGIAFGLLLVLGPGAIAAAQDAEDVSEGQPPGISMSVATGYALATADRTADPWGLGSGVRIGTTLSMGMYVELMFDASLGESDVAIAIEQSRAEIANQVPPTPGLLTTRSMFFGQLFAVDTELAEGLTLRLGGVVGLHRESVRTCQPGFETRVDELGVEHEIMAGVSCKTEITLALYLAPSAQVLLSLGDFHLGPELRLNGIANEDNGFDSVISSMLLFGYTF